MGNRALRLEGPRWGELLKENVSYAGVKDDEAEVKDIEATRVRRNSLTSLWTSHLRLREIIRGQRDNAVRSLYDKEGLEKR